MHNTLIDESVSLHFAAAGAGVQFLRELWATPGSSRYLTGASLLQAREELEDFIGFQPEEGYCSKTTALNMAVTAFLHAARSSRADVDLQQPIGVAVTAAVASDRIPRGDQRAHIGIVSEGEIFHRSIDFDKCEGEENRTRHDALIAAALRDFVIEVVTENIDERTFIDFSSEISERPCFMPDGRRLPASSESGLLFPANFNPVHEGHWGACDHAEAKTGQQVELMIEACPANKPAIPIPEILRRIARVQLEGMRRSKGPRPVTITFGEATYLEKARAHPGSRFIVGADAALRLLDPVWGHDIAAMLAEFESLETTFLVQRRRIGDQTFGISDMKIPLRFRNLFRPLDGYTEISSSEIRSRTKAA